MAVITFGGRVTLRDVDSTSQKLAKGNYMLMLDGATNEYYLVPKPDFKLPSKIYGKKTHQITKRWLTSYRNNSQKNMGIILTGLKGGGKTITAQKFCVESEMPVIIINDAHEGADFVNFITRPELENCIIFIDEFEKIYSDQDRNDGGCAKDLLALMDGNYQTKLVFLLTVNEFRVNRYMVNRLNRIKYKESYSNMDQETMDEVIDDMLDNKEHRNSIYEFFDVLNMCTFDLLVNLIKEMNLFQEDAISCGKHLNLEVESRYYGVTEVFNGEEHRCHAAHINLSHKVIDINRKELEYLPKEERAWEVSLEMDTCKVTRLNGNKHFIIEDKDGGKFIFKEDPIVEYSVF